MPKSKIEYKNPEDLYGWCFESKSELYEGHAEVTAAGFEAVVNSYYDRQGDEPVLVDRLTIIVPGQRQQHVYLSPPTDPAMTTRLVVRDEYPPGEFPRACTEDVFTTLFNITESQD